MTKTTAAILISFALAGVLLGGAVEEKPSLNAFRVAPSYFIPNHGVDKNGRKLVDSPEVTAFIQTSRGRVLFTPGGAFIGMAVGEVGLDAGQDAIPVSGSPVAGSRGRHGGKTVTGVVNGHGDTRRTVVLSAGFASTSRRKGGTSPAMSLCEPMPGNVNFFRGSQESWRTDIPTFRKLVYEGVWDGIDVEFLGYLDRLEYRLIVHPGFDPEDAVMETGAETLTLNETGSLTIALAGTTIEMSRPQAWQEKDGQKTPVQARFRVLAGGHYGFETGAFDPALDLIIDPVLTWSTYLGTDVMHELGHGVVVDASGNTYVTGRTESSNFPTTVGAYDTVYNGGPSDIFVMKLNPDGSTIAYSTFIGGSSSDYEYSLGIAVDTVGNAYITGWTASSDFPATAGAYDTVYNGGSSDLFVTKLNAAGSALVYSTFIGGSDSDFDWGIAVDTTGNAYIIGWTWSSDFPMTPGAYDTTLNGGEDVFVTKLNAAGSALVYSTFIGGSSEDLGRGIAVNASGNAFVTGETFSSDFPTTTGAYDTSCNGNGDLFVVKMNAAGSALAYATFLGGSNSELGYGGLAVDAAGNTFVTGHTVSSDFPTTVGAYDTTFNGSDDVFVTKLNAAGSALVYSTFLGGSEKDNGWGIAIDTSGNAYVTGWTGSSDFPATVGAHDTTFNGSDDVFITKLNAAGSALTYSTFLGGNNNDRGYGGIAVDAAGNAYVTGSTGSTDFPTAIPYPYEGWVVFVTKLNSAGSTLIYSTFFGGLNRYDSYGSSIAVDAAGDVYVMGYTSSATFPTTVGAYDTAFNGDPDVVVTKLNAAGSSLAYSTFIGGSDFDYSSDLAVDTSGNAYMTGNTSSVDFPTTAGAYDTTHNLTDVFVTKLNPTGSTLVYSTMIGGHGSDTGRDIVVDPDGSAYVTGVTSSSDFPTTVGAYDTIFNSGDDVFVTKLNAAGSALAYSTFLGGSGTDWGEGITRDTVGNVYVTGGTYSSDFPTTAGAFDTTSNLWDAFVTKLNAAGSALAFSTLIGGSDDENGIDIAVDISGNVYVTGVTSSSDFPTTGGGYDTTFNSGDDVFVTKLNSVGSALVYSSFIGGSSDDDGTSIAVDTPGNAYVTGCTSSPNFPVTAGADDASHNGDYDVFITKLNTAGSVLVYSTFIGGGSTDIGDSLALDISGNAYVTGHTESSDFPTTAGAYDTVNESGKQDAAFVLVMAIGCGDLNHDGGIHDTDLSILSAYLAGAALPSGTMPADCLLTPDGEINAADLCWLKNRVAGNIH